MHDLLRRYGLNNLLLEEDKGGGGGSGSTGGDPEKDEKDEKDEKPSGKTFTEEELKAVSSREKKDGRRRAFEDLGFASEEEMKAELDRLKEIEKKGLSDLEKKQKDADDREAAAKKETETARATTLTARVERALEKAGVPADTSSEVRPMVNVAHDVTEEDLATTVQALKTKLPALFEVRQESEEEAEQGGAPASGDPGKKPPDRKKVTDKKAEAQKRLDEMFPEVAARRAREQASVTT